MLRFVHAADRLPDEPTTTIWAALKLALAAPIAPGVAAAAIGTLPRDVERNRERAREFPRAVAGGPFAMGRTQSLPSSGRYLVTSDIHRCLPGKRDWPRLQHTAALHRVMLDHYADEQWGLIEAGDIEDTWMVGGSAQGAAFDLARVVGMVVAPFDRSLADAVGRAQIHTILANYPETYRLIADRFATPGRYWRITGNHDDALRHPEVLAAIRESLGDVPLLDLVTLTGDDDLPEAVVSHGHLTDPWNGPIGAWRGRMITWLANGIADLRGRELGLVGDRARRLLVAGRASNRLRALTGPFSVDREQFTLDESALHRAFADHFGEGEGPWLVLGHTHVPNDAPWDPASASRYRRYVNAGSSVAPRIVTAVEWDGALRPRRPRLVVVGLRSDLAAPAARDTGPTPEHALRLTDRQVIGDVNGEPVERGVLSAPD